MNKFRRVAGRTALANAEFQKQNLQIETNGARQAQASASFQNSMLNFISIRAISAGLTCKRHESLTYQLAQVEGYWETNEPHNHSNATV